MGKSTRGDKIFMLLLVSILLVMVAVGFVFALYRAIRG